MKKVDLYTKIVLTIITITLFGVFVKNVGIIKEANARLNMSGDYYTIDDVYYRLDDLEKELENKLDEIQGSTVSQFNHSINDVYDDLWDKIKEIQGTYPYPFEDHSINDVYDKLEQVEDKTFGNYCLHCPEDM